MAYIRQHTKKISTLCSYLICFDLIATFNWVYFKTLVEMADRQTDRKTDRPPDQPTDRHIDGKTDGQMIDR